MRSLHNIVLCFSLLSAASIVAQSPGAGPVPPALSQAKKVFLSNAGSDSGLFPHPFTGTQGRAYNTFYARVKALGRFDIVSNPGESDLVLELQLIAPSGPKDVDKSKGASDPLPMFRLVIWDSRTHFILWTLNESIERANLQAKHDRNFDQALDALAQSLGKITSPAQQP